MSLPLIGSLRKQKMPAPVSFMENVSRNSWQFPPMNGQKTLPNGVVRDKVGI